METTIAYWVYIGIMENKMETTSILGLYEFPKNRAVPSRAPLYHRGSFIFGGV